MAFADKIKFAASVPNDLPNDKTEPADLETTTAEQLRLEKRLEQIEKQLNVPQRGGFANRIQFAGQQN
jgi:hypothetical protein